MSKEKKLTGYPSIDKPWLKYYDEDQINKPLPKSSLYQYIIQQNAGHYEDIAIDFYGKKISFGTMISNIDYLSSIFLSKGIKKGDIVSFISITTPELIYAVYALNKIGAISNMIDPRSSNDIIDTIISNANSRFIVVMDLFVKTVEHVDNIWGEKSTVIIIPFAKSLPLYAKIPFSIKRERISNIKHAVEWKEFIRGDYRLGLDTKSFYENDHPAVIIYTGGTTGTPKGVILSDDCINSIADQYKRSGLDLQRKQIWQAVSAPFIAYVFVFSMHVPLSYGMICKIVVYDPKTIALDIVKNKYNHITSNPAVWENVIHLPEAQKRDFSHLIAPATGADYMSEKLEAEINDFFLSHGCKWKICQGYGLTEVGSGISVNLSGNGNRMGSVGLPFIETVVSVFEPSTDKELKYNEEGEICISGPSLMNGYFKNGVATNELIKIHSDGLRWLHSGDMGRIDEDGFIFISGRIKRMFVRYDGAKIFPPIIEHVIMEHESVEKVTVVKMQDPMYKTGFLPAACIVLKDLSCDMDDIRQQLEKICEEKLPVYEQPVKWMFLKDFPLTPIGKVDYRKLEESIASD